MSHARVAILSLLLVAVVAVPSDAQTPTDTAAADTTPKKKSRFGGLVSKAKAVAGNKTVQDAAKGAAANVACTVVPGAAVVSAATNSGPCQNAGLLAAVKSGGVAGVAATAAAGMGSNAAANAASKLGGTRGAAAAGALTAVGGSGGLKNATGSAITGAMAKKVGAAAMPNAAAMAAAQAAALKAAGGNAANAKAIAAANGAAGADMAAAIAAMGALGAAAGNLPKVETVDFRELKALLPESVRGMRRTNATGQKGGAMGIQISTAEGKYSSDDGAKSVDIEIADIGSVTGLAGMATYAWANTEIDSESDNGYEKTTKFKGYKAIEKYNKQSQSGELSVLVGGRFVAGASGNGVDMDALKAALGAVDLGKLERMKPKGPK